MKSQENTQLGARFCIDPKRHFSKGLQVISGKCENQRPNNLENFEGMIVRNTQLTTISSHQIITIIGQVGSRRRDCRGSGSVGVWPGESDFENFCWENDENPLELIEFILL